MPSSITSPRQDRLLFGITCACVGLTLAIICAMVLRAPFDHSETPIYLRASWDWWAGRGLYDKNINLGIDGFLYFPQFAILYSPFALLDFVIGHHQPIHVLAIGDCLWRAVGLAMFLAGLWRLSGHFAPQHRLALFNLLVIMSFPPAVAALRNGQANLHIAGLMLLAANELTDKKWSRAALWLILGFLIKPVMAVMILLAAVTYRKMFVRLAVGLAVGMLFPFLLQKPHYVSDQYAVFFGTTLASSTPDREFCNLHGFFTHIGINIPPAPYQLITLAVAGLTLALWLLARRREEPARSFFLFALSACFIVLFNPRTESNSYVIIAPAVALAAVLALFRFQNLIAGWLLIAIDFCLICDSWAYHATENWLKPLVSLLFFAMLAARILRKSQPQLEPEKTESMVSA